MRRSSAIGRLLVRCTAEHDWSAPSDDAVRAAEGLDLDAVAAAARFHGVTGCVHRSLLPAVAAWPGAATLEADHHEGIDRHLRALGDLAELGRALHGHGVEWLVVKGPVLAEVFYARSGLRTYNDLDLVVPGRQLGAALAAVEEAGGRLVDRNWPLLRALRPGEVLARLRHGTLLDLHWHLVHEARTRRQFAIPLADLRARARPVRLGSVQAASLDATDTLLHLALHGSLSGGNRLVWLKDVERVVAAGPPDWDEVVTRARAWGVGPPAALSLARSRAVLGADVPAGVPDALAGGRPWLALASLTDRLSPPARATGGRSVSRLVSRSTRRDTASSVAELGHRIVDAVAGGHRLSRTPPEPDTDPDSPASARHASGTAEDRQAFLDAVGDEAP